MNKNFYKRLSQIILEADEEEVKEEPDKGNEETTDSDTPEGQTNDYQMDDSDFDENGGEGNTKGDSEGGDEGGKTELTEEDLDDQTNDYQMDDSDFDENGGDGNTEGDSEGGDEGEAGESTEDGEPSGSDNNNDAIKKYKLASQYKEMLLIIANLEKSINTVKNTTNDPERVHYIYIIKQKVENLKSKINFFIVNNFITKPYEELLSSFLFLKKELELIISLIEKVLDEE